ncbi:MAG TPA: 3D domain-containing protein [Pyrinomonadaceae bacterium]|nr:3D domain-containing protein [Pyrinomonadaceae bacterium]
MKSLFGGSVGLGLALLTASLLFTSPLAAETSNTSAKPQPTPVQVNQTETPATSASITSEAEAGAVAKAIETEAKPGESGAATDAAKPVTPPIAYVATAYSLRGRGASGLGVRKGTIAADPRVLPFGTRVRIDAGPYSGEYVVTDSGSAVKGNKIDVWVPTYSEACRFGRRSVKLTVLSYGARRGKARQK